MPISKMSKTDVNQSHSMFEQSLKHKEMPYKSLSLDQFSHKFFKDHDAYKIISLVDKEKNIIKGFVSGVVVTDQHKAYLSMIIVDPKYRRSRIGSSLLSAFESLIKNTYPDIKTIDIVFFNPVQLEWIIPHTPNHDHPNAPGVDISSGAYQFFKAKDYLDFAKQNSYYKDIKGYTYPQKILDMIKDLCQEQISIMFYDPLKHHGFDYLFEDLKNPYWTLEITKAAHQNQPILIAEDEGQIIGFTGPLSVQESLRGYFAGIGVHSKYRGLGIGKVLFSSLCLQLSKLGATYMTLFTGENNPARKIYENESFKIVKSWANLRKDV